MTFQSCSSGWCYTFATAEPLSLSEAVTYTIELSTTSQDASVLLDRVVPLPTVFLNASDLLGPEENEQFQTTCNVIDNDMKYAHLFFSY